MSTQEYEVVMSFFNNHISAIDTIMIIAGSVVSVILGVMAYVGYNWAGRVAKNLENKVSEYTGTKGFEELVQKNIKEYIEADAFQKLVQQNIKDRMSSISDKDKSDNKKKEDQKDKNI